MGSLTASLEEPEMPVDLAAVALGGAALVAFAEEAFALFLEMEAVGFEDCGRSRFLVTSLSLRSTDPLIEEADNRD